MSGASSTLGMERKGSFSKPTTPKKIGCGYVCKVCHTRVEDENAIEKKYTIGEVLGQGAFGLVKEVTNKVTQDHLAMKIVLKDKVGCQCTRSSIACAHTHTHTCTYTQ